MTVYLVVYGWGIMDNQRTEISDRVRMVVIHGTDRKIIKVEAYGFQF